MNELGLIQLDKDFSITSQQMISCCNSMLGRWPLVLDSAESLKEAIAF